MKAHRLAVHVVAASFFFLPAAASAQSGITGVVRDTSGAVLPGVTVEATSPALIEGARVVVSDGQGVFTIVDLRPGPYAVTFTLVGFRTLKREGIALPAQFTATVNAELVVGGLEETVTVSGEAPLVDIRSIRAQMQIPQDTMESLPGAGHITTLSMVVPGATLRAAADRSVGGLNNSGQTQFNVHGSWYAVPVVDGVNVEIPQLDSGTMVYNQAAMQEVVLETSGVGADRDTGGIQINIVGKDGGNTFSGTGQLGFSAPDLEASNWDEELGARGVAEQAAKSLKKYRDTAGALGGPLQRDRLWLFGAFREGVTQQNATGRYYNKLQQPASFLFEPDLSLPAHSNDFSRDFTLRLTWQAAAKHKIALSSSFQPNCNCIYNILQASTPLSPEATGEHRYNPNYLGSAAWTFPASNRLLLEAGWTVNSTNQNDTATGSGLKYNPIEVPLTNIRIEDQGLNLIYGSVNRRTLPRQQYQERFAASYVTGSHNFKTGFWIRHLINGDIENRAQDLFQYGSGMQYRLNSSHVPNRITLLDAPWNFEETVRDIAIYAQDQWTIKKLTANVGVRYGDGKTSTPVQILPAGLWVPERRFEPTDNVPHWRNLSPRLGIAYDLFGTGRTAIKASVGRYPDRTQRSLQNPVTNLTRSTFVTWNDRNGSFLPDCDLHNPAGDSSGADVCGPWQSPTFGQPNIVTNYTDEAREGFNKQAYNWQSSVSVQHELRPGLSMNIGYFRTWYGGFLVTDNPNVDPTSYDPYCVTAPVDSRLPNDVSGQPVCGFYDVKPAFFGKTTGGNVKQASNFGTQSQVFNGVDVTMAARFGRGGELQGGLSLGRTTTDNCFAVDSPEQMREGFCNLTPPWSAGTQIKFMAVYPLVYDISTSVIYQNVPGIPITASFVATNADIRTTLGRDLTACTGTIGPCTQNVTVELLPNTAMYEDRLNQVDLRFARTFNLGGTRRLKGSLDLLNLLNANNVLNLNARYGSTWQNALQVLTGRLVKFGVQFDF